MGTIYLEIPNTFMFQRSWKKMIEKKSFIYPCSLFSKFYFICNYMGEYPICVGTYKDKKWESDHLELEL